MSKSKAPKIDIAALQKIQIELQAAVAELQGINKGKRTASLACTRCTRTPSPLETYFSLFISRPSFQYNAKSTVPHGLRMPVLTTPPNRARVLRRGDKGDHNVGQI